MKIVVIGGTGLIGSKVVAKLAAQGHETVAASPTSGVDTLTGEGLAEVLQGAAAVVDVTNSPSFEESAATEFFRTSTRNQLEQEVAAGVRHHVALSVVGTDRLAADIEYFRAKVVQEQLIRASSVPYTIVHATQFFEFVKSIADASTEGGTVRLPPVFIQPIAADDVAAAVARVAVNAPHNGIVEVGGPERFHLDELVRQGLSARNDPRAVITDPKGRYFGGAIADLALVPADGAQLGATHFRDWLAVS